MAMTTVPSESDFAAHAEGATCTIHDGFQFWSDEPITYEVAALASEIEQITGYHYTPAETRPIHRLCKAIRAKIAGHALDRRAYNGWTNYATWHVNLILTNDQTTDRLARTVAAEHFYRRRWAIMQGQTYVDKNDPVAVRNHALYAAAEGLKGWLSAKIDEFFDFDRLELPSVDPRPYEHFKRKRAEQRAMKESLTYIIKQAILVHLDECDWVEVADHLVAKEGE